MQPQPYFVQADIGEFFETILVPAIFKPYADALIERARPIGPSDRVLDLGCGTGIVARVLRDRLGGGVRIAGVDVSAPMIAKARSLAPEIEWHEANAMALPFGPAAFDLILSQQMVQFVPDPLAALREARRVLAPGGRMLVSAWRSRAEQPLFDELGRLAERHLGPANDKRYSLDADRLRALCAEAGFTQIAIETCSLVDRYRVFPVRQSTLAGNHDTSALSQAELDAKLDAIEAEAAGVLARYATGDGLYAAPSITNVAIVA